jgi:hypothetical protein
MNAETENYLFLRLTQSQRVKMKMPEPIHHCRGDWKMDFVGGKSRIIPLNDAIVSRFCIVPLFFGFHLANEIHQTISKCCKGTPGTLATAGVR